MSRFPKISSCALTWAILLPGVESGDQPSPYATDEDVRGREGISFNESLDGFATDAEMTGRRAYA